MVDAVVEYDYTAQEEDELTLKVGDVISNVTKASKGWCEGTLNGRRGMFPDNFVKEIKKDVKMATPARRQNAGAVSEIRSKLSSVIIPGAAPPPIVAKKPNKRAKVTFAYSSQQEDELNLEVGNIVEILKQEDPDWWEGSLNGKTGMFPSNFVEIITQPDGEKPATDEVSEIRGRKVEGVGFGNIFAGGQIVLRSKVDKKESIDLVKDRSPADTKQQQVKLKPAIPTSSPSQPTTAQQAKSSTKPVLRAKVTYPYSGENEDELDLMEGDIIVILDQHLEDDGWWKGELNGKVGVFPDNFVELLPQETEKPLKPVLPPPPSVGSASAAKTPGGTNISLTDPQKGKQIRKDEPKPVLPSVGRPLPEAGKQPELKPTLETDDHKAKKNKEPGTLDSVKPSENALPHPTAHRAKPPVRRPPGSVPILLREAPTPDEKLTSATKVQPLPHVKEDPVTVLPHNAQKLTKDLSVDATNHGYTVSEQFTELQHEVAQLRESMDLFRKSQEKKLYELTVEIDEEKKIRLNMQVELERLKKLMNS